MLPLGPREEANTIQNFTGGVHFFVETHSTLDALLWECKATRNLLWERKATTIQLTIGIRLASLFPILVEISVGACRCVGLGWCQATGNHIDYVATGNLLLCNDTIATRRSAIHTSQLSSGSTPTIHWIASESMDCVC